MCFKEMAKNEERILINIAATINFWNKIMLKYFRIVVNVIIK
jgi:hypothetical protein